MTNQEYLAAVASALGPLVAEVVFTGGLVVQEYWTIPALREPRATVDADVIVEAATYTEYAAFGKRLRERGFLQLAEDATPPYRWIKDDLIRRGTLQSHTYPCIASMRTWVLRPRRSCKLIATYGE